jgi:hypothetical protein
MPERLCGAANPGCSRLSGGSLQRVNASVSGIASGGTDVAACGRRITNPPQVANLPHKVPQDQLCGVEFLGGRVGYAG